MMATLSLPRFTIGLLVLLFSNPTNPDVYSSQPTCWVSHIHFDPLLCTYFNYFSHPPSLSIESLITSNPKSRKKKKHQKQETKRLASDHHAGGKSSTYTVDNYAPKDGESNKLTSFSIVVKGGDIFYCHQWQRGRLLNILSLMSRADDVRCNRCSSNTKK